MSIEFVDGGRTWRVYTDPQGRVHDEPVEPAAEQSLEPSDEETTP